MLQDPWVFTDTIEANVRMRDPSISSHTVRQAAEAVGANIFIEKLSEGYNPICQSVGQTSLLAKNN